MKKQWEAIRNITRTGNKKTDLPFSILKDFDHGIFFQDRNGDVIFVNIKAAEILGATSDKIFGIKELKHLWKTSWNITTEDGDPIPFDKTPFMKTLETGKAQSDTLLIRQEGMEERLVAFRSFPIFEDSTSVPTAVITGISDITREKKLSVELKLTESLFQTFMKHTPNLFWVADEDMRLIAANVSFFRYFGLTEKDINKKIDTIIPAAVSQALHHDHVSVLKTGSHIRKEQKVKWADGTDLSFLIHIFSINTIPGKKMVGGHAIKFQGKNLIEKQLKEANEQLLHLSRAASNAIWEWDIRSGKIFRNEVLLDMIGYPIEDTNGLDWWKDRIHPEDRERVMDMIEMVINDRQKSWEDTYRFQCEDGYYKYMRDRGFVLYENDEPVKMVGSLHDISDLKDLEDRLLAEKIQRQKEISETIIRVQEKERTKIGQELHDNINQILGTVSLFIERLNTNTAEDELIKNKAIKYISIAIEEIRKLSRELVLPELKENGLIDSIKTLIEDVHICRIMKISLDCHEEVELAGPGKKLTLFRIVQEQLKNIIKYSKASEAEISLHAENKEIQLAIKDNGIGFDPKQTFRGIGLSNIYERTKFYNGYADVQTSPGHGCLLIVRIPLN